MTQKKKNTDNNNSDRAQSDIWLHASYYYKLDDVML